MYIYIYVYVCVHVCIYAYMCTSELLCYIYVYIYVHILFIFFSVHILSRYGLSQDIEYSFLCYIVKLVVCPPYIYEFVSANLKLSIHPYPTSTLLGNHKTVLCVCESVSV